MLRLSFLVKSFLGNATDPKNGNVEIGPFSLVIIPKGAHTSPLFPLNKKLFKAFFEVHFPKTALNKDKSARTPLVTKIDNETALKETH